MKIILAVLLLIVLTIFSNNIVQSSTCDKNTTPPGQSFVTMDLYPHQKSLTIESSSHSQKIMLGSNQTSNGGMHIAKMTGDPFEIRTNVWVGGIKQEVVVDSGSILLVVPSVACSTCEQAKPYYQPSENVEYIGCNTTDCALNVNYCRTTRNHPQGICGINIRYVDTTEVDAYVVRDSFRLSEDMEEVPLIFGSIYHAAGHSLKYGIMGMGNTCSKCTKTPIDEVFTRFNLSKTFALWLDEEYTGVMTLGDLDPQYISGSLHYTPLLAIDTIHYGVLPSYALVTRPDGNAVVISPKDIGVTILDTGSSYTLLARDAYLAFRFFLSLNCSLPGVCGPQTLFDGYCMDLKDDAAALFPTIELGLLGGAKLSIPPSTYMATVFQNGVRFRCLGVRQSPLEKKSVIGLSWLRNNYIIFDKEHNRIGIGTKSATYPEQDLFKPTDQSPSVSLVDAKPTTNQPKQQQPPEVKDCGVHVSHSMIATSKMDNEQVSHWIFTISNKKDTPLNNLKMVWSNNLVSLEIGYNFVTHELQPPMDIPAKTDFSFHYIARGMDPIFVGFPDLMECNEYNYDVSITRSVNIQAEEKEQSKVLQSIHRNNTEGIEYSGPAQKPVSKEIEQSRQEFSSLDVPCSLKYNQHKGYQWRDSDGGTVTWYEVDIVNQSNSTFVTSLIVSTLDSIVNVIGMDMEVTPEKSTILSLPKNVTIIPHEDYRWVYATRQTSSVSYSLVHPVVCNTA